MTRLIEHSRRHWPFDLRHLAVRARLARTSPRRRRHHTNQGGCGEGFAEAEEAGQEAGAEDAEGAPGRKTLGCEADPVA